MGTLEIDGLLPAVTRPARYCGGEWNAVVKPWQETPLRLLLAYPDVYEAGMAKLGLHQLYRILNAGDDVLCERAFAPWPDMEEAMRQRGVPLWSLESRHAAGDFDVIAFSVGEELVFTNLLNMLDLAGLPLLADERVEALPLVIAGGYGLLNPEPLADFVDAFALGDGEELVLDVVDRLRRWKGAGGTKAELLRELATVPGVYVPSLYRAGARPAARRLEALPPPLTRPIVPLMEKVQERAIMEIQRGWLGGCGFGATGSLDRPRLERPAAEVIAAARELLANTGYDHLALVAVRAAEHSQIEELAQGLRRSLPEEVSLTLASMEAKPRAVEIADILAGQRRRWLSLAPQAGTERLRRALGEEASDGQVLEAAELAYARGWTGLRLHFLIGLPGETEDDLRAIAALAGEAREMGRRHHGAGAGVRASVSNFLPKAHTPFQWARQATAEELTAKGQALARALKRAGVEAYLEPPESSLLAGVLARGDRRLGAAIRRAWELGARFDGWRQQFDWGRWQRALGECGLEPSSYLRERPLDEPLPWSHLDWGFREEELWAAWQRIRAGGG